MKVEGYGIRELRESRKKLRRTTFSGRAGQKNSSLLMGKNIRRVKSRLPDSNHLRRQKTPIKIETKEVIVFLKNGTYLQNPFERCGRKTQM